MLHSGSPKILRMSTSCGALLRELEQIWDEIGESEAEKDQMLMELEKECLEVYRRKVRDASNAKGQLRQAVASREAELATLIAALGELNLHSQMQSNNKSSSLKEQLASATALIEELRLKKDDRMKQFADVRAQLRKITREILGSTLPSDEIQNGLSSDEEDLSLIRLTEYQKKLCSLQKDKSERIKRVLEHVNEVHDLCGLLGLDFSNIVRDVDPSLHGSSPEQSTNISDRTLQGLELAIAKLKSDRKARLQKLNDIMVSLNALWKLMDTPEDERICLSKLGSIYGCSNVEVTEPGALSMDVIDQGSAEVERLNKLKASKMKEIVIKKRLELEELCRLTHLVPDTSTAADKSNALIDSGLVDPSELLANIEVQIAKGKEEALSRKDIVDRIDRWLAACEEENWLEEYNRDENRYNAGRGSHINLKRAERARAAVNKIPVIVDNLIAKTRAWEEERKVSFLYDGVHLVKILEDYKLARVQKEEEKRRHRDYKKLQDLLLTEKEAVYGSKPSPKRTNSSRKANSGYHRSNGNGTMTPSSRWNSAGSQSSEMSTPRSHSGRQNGYFKEMGRMHTAPLNFVALPKEDTFSFASISGSEPGSPPSLAYFSR